MEPATDIAKPLEPSDIRVLEILLARYGTPGEGLDFTGLHAFLTAVISAPNNIPLGTWLPRVLSSADTLAASPFATPDEYQHYVGLVMRLWNGIVRTLSHPEVAFDIPDTAQPTPDARERWLQGYRRGIALSSSWKYYEGVDLVCRSMLDINGRTPAMGAAAAAIARFFTGLRRIELELWDVEPAPFAEDEAEELAALLESLDPNAEAEDRDALDLAFVHGTLTWMVTMPQPEPLLETLDLLYLEPNNVARDVSADTVLQITRLAARLARETREQLDAGDFLPLLPTFVDGAAGRRTYVSAVNWVMGYKIGARLAEETWKPLDRGDYISQRLMQLDALCEPPIVELAGDTEMAQFYISLAEPVTDIYDYFDAGSHEPVRVVHPPGRNAPCPCGSGKKYKKCCGA